MLMEATTTTSLPHTRDGLICLDGEPVDTIMALYVTNRGVLAETLLTIMFIIAQHVICSNRQAKRIGATIPFQMVVGRNKFGEH